MKILITGASGFVGSHLVKELKKQGYNDINEFSGDIRNPEEVKKDVQGCDVVFNLAGVISYWSEMNKLAYEVNVLGAKNMVEACLEYGVKKLIHISSDVTVGIKKNGLGDETIPYSLGGLKVNYCDTKHLGEEEILKGIAKGLDAVIVCPASVYGAGDARKIQTDMTFNFKFPIGLLYPDNGIAVVDVNNVVNGIIKAWQAGRKGERYQLVGENLSFCEIRKIIAEEIGLKPPFIKIPNWAFTFLAYVFLGFSKIIGKKPKLTPEMARINRANLFYSNKKAKEELGLTFKPFKESIKDSVKWYKENGYL